MTTTLLRRPEVPADALLAGFVVPRHFGDATFESYRPAHPSQAVARERLAQVADGLAAPPAKGLARLLHRSSARAAAAVYLDGGFGVGKTHLLAGLAHAVGQRSAGDVVYGTFVEYTHLVGAIGFAATVRELSARRVVCIDEFELDDPGDTVLMARLLREVGDAGVTLAATSNTLPESLGEGRFAAEDFLREIQALAARFEVLRIDGDDYRHRNVVTASRGLPDEEVRSRAVGEGVTCDDFGALVEHLRTVHPSRYGALLEGVRRVGLTGVGRLTDQNDALRLVVLVDRLYDRDVPVLLGGSGTSELFTDAMLRGGYRKKYYRALSRLGALTEG
ncbi:cell division protein ZapE [Actinotalea sp. M2MS4P-6]|uniref:cell division protein ZapE n=1 Tax=Actinotalea sp. M2MS4P-6 TaxID=2983762 RepID=UPI0021E40077|nr:cell division protein ZapE [Actinotalea sp. M2MS4P-6]MCV2396317.1 cell division protein ZapE [Actinotalea sp. M2MS4P-6]